MMDQSIAEGWRDCALSHRRREQLFLLGVPIRVGDHPLVEDGPEEQANGQRCANELQNVFGAGPLENPAENGRLTRFLGKRKRRTAPDDDWAAGHFEPNLAREEQALHHSLGKMGANL